MSAVGIHAAACDLACADAGFRAAASASGVTMLTALLGLVEQASSEFPRDSEDAVSLLALMEFQAARVMAAASGQVRGGCPSTQGLGFMVLGF